MDNLPARYPFANVSAERLYHFHKLYAEDYTTNTCNLEAPWKPVVASILEGIVKKVSDKLGRLIDISVQQEQPLAPPAFAAATVDADSTMTSSKHKGTVYPDVFVLRYLPQVCDNFRNLTHMGHDVIDYLVFAELKRSIKCAFIKEGLKPDNSGYPELMDSFRKAAIQAARQAFVAMKRPGETNSDVILIAVVGTFWMWCMASRAQILGLFPGQQLEEILEKAHITREKDSFQEQKVVEIDNESESCERPTHVSSALLCSIMKQNVFRGRTGSNLGWSDLMMLDSRESEMAIRTLTQALLKIVQEK